MAGHDAVGGDGLGEVYESAVLGNIAGNETSETGFRVNLTKEDLGPLFLDYHIHREWKSKHFSERQFPLFEGIVINSARLGTGAKVKVFHAITFLFMNSEFLCQVAAGQGVITVEASKFDITLIVGFEGQGGVPIFFYKFFKHKGRLFGG